MTTEATLCYIVKYGKILLIKKKTGFGAGVWNGPGGKVNPGETLEDAAARETYEEARVIPAELKKVGELEFYFGEKFEWLVHVFITDEYDGIEKETKEAVPKWFPVNKIPYSKMWPDDVIWLPLLLSGKQFQGKFYFDEQHKLLLSHEIMEVATL